MLHILPMVFALFVSSYGIEVSSKLDFGENSGPSLIQTSQRNIPLKYDHVEIKKKTSGNIESKGIICSSSGCNSTSSNNEGDSIKTDVIVQVKTSVDIKNKSKSIEDVPDIPVILGTNGIGPKNYIPGIQRGLQYQPGLRTYSGNSNPLIVTNIEDAFPSLTSTLVQGNLYRAQTNNGIDIKFKTLPPVVISMPDGYQHKNNGVEIKVPYFEPAYHNHYFSENSPPQFAYYPKQNSVHNPVAFNNFHRPSISTLSSWNKNYPVVQSHRHNDNCNNNRNTHGLHWYPKSDSQFADSKTQKRYSSRSSGVEIDDKLAPLN